MKLETLNKIFLTDIRELFDALIQLNSEFPHFIQVATDNELRSFFKSLFIINKNQSSQLRDFFSEIEENVRGKKSAAIQTIIAEVEKFLDTNFDHEVIDVGLIAFLVKIESYKMALSLTVKNYAMMLQLSYAEDITYNIYEASREMKEKLMGFAETKINIETD
jgi:ferritin-like metal-binding protein YciE